MRIRWRSIAASGTAIVAVLASLALPAATSAYTFGNNVVQTGPEQVVFNHTADDGSGALADACEQGSRADQPPRASRFHDPGDPPGVNRVQLTLGAKDVNYRMVGADLDHVARDCQPTHPGPNPADNDPSHYHAHEWMGATYSFPSTNTVYGIIHNEYQATDFYPEQCSYTAETGFSQCQNLFVTLVTSINGGATFTHATPPNHVVANLPYRYENDWGTNGYVGPTSIIKRQPDDGYYYMMVNMRSSRGDPVTGKFRDQPIGSCILRTPDLADRTAWRAYLNGSWSGTFVNPYDPSYDPSTDPPANHVCSTVSGANIAGLTVRSLTYNTFFNKYMVLGTKPLTDGAGTPGVYYALSDDMVNWGDLELVMQLQTLGSWRDAGCTGENPTAYHTIIDATDTSDNFERPGKRGYIYFTRFIPRPNCVLTGEADVIRVPIEFIYSAAYPRPGGATPLRVPLVPRFRPCPTASANSTHVGPLAGPSCAPPTSPSPLTTGTSGQGTGYGRMDAIPDTSGTSTDESDLRMTGSVTDVRQSDGTDYGGQVVLTSTLRLTDKGSGPTRVEPATVQDFDFSLPLTCTPTGASGIGSACNGSASANALVPGFAVARKRAVISAFQVRLLDTGADGSLTPPSDPIGRGCPPTCGSGDEKVFMSQGLFAP